LNFDWIYIIGELVIVGVVVVLKGNMCIKVIGWDLIKEVIGGIDSGLVIVVV